MNSEPEIRTPRNEKDVVNLRRSISMLEKQMEKEEIDEKIDSIQENAIENSQNKEFNSANSEFDYLKVGSFTGFEN